MARAWNTPVFILATLYFVLDGVFSYLTQPIAEWIAKKRLFERARRWVISLPPYPSLALFAVPVIILEPAKPLAGYLIGTGHFFAGAVTFITAEVLKLTLVERLFQLNRDKRFTKARRQRRILGTDPLAAIQICLVRSQICLVRSQ